MKMLTPHDLLSRMRGAPGLIVGSAVTKHPGFDPLLTNRLASAVGRDLGRYIDAGDSLALPLTVAQLRDETRAQLKESGSPSSLADIAAVRWGAILSSSLDLGLEEHLRQEADKHPSSHKVTVLSDYAGAAPPRTLQVFKLLGMAERDDFVLSTASYLIAKPRWRKVERAFADSCRGSPVVCLGMEDSEWVLRDLVSDLLADHHTTPPSFIFLRDDPLAKSAVLSELISSSSELSVFDGTLGQLCDLLAKRPTLPSSVPAPKKGSDGDGYEQFRHLVVSVTRQAQQLPTKSSETNRLLNVLFSPELPNWEPYACDLDLPRNGMKDVLENARGILKEQSFKSSALAIRGTVASGKTTFLKRLAFELAKDGHEVLWLRPSYFPDNRRLLGQIFERLGEQTWGQNRRVVIIMDDPIGFPGVAARDVAAASLGSGVPTLLVVSARISDWETRDAKEFVGPLPVRCEVVLPDLFDPAEWEALPGYLARIKIAPDLAAANDMISQVKSRHPKDILSGFYWLLPETRTHISAGIRHEYFRLGDVAGFTKVIIGEVNATSDLLRRAYEMVAVSSFYRLALPLEVLVSALDVAYNEWLGAASEDGPSWGILYAEEESDLALTYRTRSAIVDDLIVKAVNGGSIGHSGEVAILKKIASACTGTNPVYREYCARLLINNPTLSGRLDFQEGLDLFDAAIEALPHEDKSLLHHKGIWIKDKGKNPLDAKRVLHDALAAKDYPYADKVEADQHIYTTLAAATLQEIAAGITEAEVGKDEVLSYLAHSKSRDFFNPHAIHVYANTINRLIYELKSPEKADKFALKVEALSEVDRALLMLRGTEHDPRSSESILMLQSVKQKLLQTTLDLDAQKADAKEMWEKFKSQEGFALVAKFLGDAAFTGGKGSAYKEAYEYADSCIGLVKAAKVTPATGLIESALYLYYNWRVKRAVEIKKEAPDVDWEMIRAYSAALVQARGETDWMSTYIHALSLSQLGKWADAIAIFSTLRRTKLPRDVMHTPRDYLLNQHGMIRQVQGVMKSGGGDNRFLYVDALHTDLIASRDDTWPRDGLTAHAYVRFSFAGPRAIKERN